MINRTIWSPLASPRDENNDHIEAGRLASAAGREVAHVASAGLHRSLDTTR